MQHAVAIMVVFELILLGSLIPGGCVAFKMDRRMGTYCGKLGIIGCGVVLLILFEGHLEMLLKWGML